MIRLTRASGRRFVLNADLIERIDRTPETVITMLDGKKYVVAESPQEVLDEIVAFRGRVAAAASQRLASGHMRIVPD